MPPQFTNNNRDDDKTGDTGFQPLRTQTHGDAGAVKPDQTATVDFSDFGVSVDALTGAGNDVSSVFDNANAVTDNDGVAGVELAVADDFEQTVEARAEDAETDDAIDAGAGDELLDGHGAQGVAGVLSNVTGDAAFAVTNGASVGADGFADGLQQAVATGRNTAVNEATTATTGGSDSVDVVGDTIRDGTDGATGDASDARGDQDARVFRGKDEERDDDDRGGDERRGDDEDRDETDERAGSENRGNDDARAEKDDGGARDDRQATEDTDAGFNSIELGDVANGTSVFFDDIDVDFGALSGDGNDMAFDIDQANTLADNDSVQGVSLRLEGGFEQRVTAEAEGASADDGIGGGFATALNDGGAGSASFLGDVLGNASASVANIAEANATATATGITQSVNTGGNVLGNSIDQTVVGGDSSVSSVGDDIVA